MRGGKRQYDIQSIARVAARKLAASGQLDARAEDQGDYLARIMERGLRAQQIALSRGKGRDHAQRSAAAAMWNCSRSIFRDRTRASNRVQVHPVDVDHIPRQRDLDGQIDARRILSVLRDCLPPEDWQLVEYLASTDGCIAEAYRSYSGKGRTSFTRSVLAMRERAREIIDATFGPKVQSWGYTG